MSLDVSDFERIEFVRPLTSITLVHGYIKLYLALSILDTFGLASFHVFMKISYSSKTFKTD
jgi:hypothetical protein